MNVVNDVFKKRYMLMRCGAPCPACRMPLPMRHICACLSEISCVNDTVKTYMIAAVLLPGLSRSVEMAPTVTSGVARLSLSEHTRVVGVALYLAGGERGSLYKSLWPSSASAHAASQIQPTSSRGLTVGALLLPFFITLCGCDGVFRLIASS